MMLTDCMEELAADIRRGVSRPVTTDPRNVTPPCVLIEPPQLYPDGTMCGTLRYRFNVLCLGLPGARIELGPLAALVEEVLAVLGDGSGWSLAELVTYVPLADGGSAEPIMAYRIQTEEYR